MPPIPSPMIRLAALTAATVAALTLVTAASASAPSPHDPLAGLGMPAAIVYETHGAYVYKCEVWTATGRIKHVSGGVIVGYIERCYLNGSAKGAQGKPRAKVQSGNGVPPA